jgi:protein TonB
MFALHAAFLVLFRRPNLAASPAVPAPTRNARVRRAQPPARRAAPENTTARAPAVSGSPSSYLRRLPMFDARPGAVPAASRLPGALGFSACTHGLLCILTLLLFGGRIAQRAAEPAAFALLSDPGLTWLAAGGPGGGGGGGGNHETTPPGRARAPGRDALTVPVFKPVQIAAGADLTEEPRPAQVLDVAATPMAAGVVFAAGALDGPPAITGSRGPGSGDGAGGGDGSGLGPGRGPGLGPGHDGGFGGGAFHPGNGVTWPVKLKEVVPRYTSEAMIRKIQGTAVLECVVLPNGRVGAVRLVRSLDAVHGLDDEAIRAARQWLFVPGMRGGQPVPVLILIEMAFNIQ